MKVVALDIGGTSIKSGLWEDGVLGQLKECDTDAKLGGKHVIEKAIAIIKTYEGFDRIGVSTAGQVDSKEGVIRYANENIPGYTGMRIKEILTDTFKVPVAIENDVNAAAIGEAQFGAGKDYRDFLCLTYGTGIGGAIVIDKKIYTGSAFSAGEFGSIIIHAEDRKVGDMFSGCYERYASTRALVAKTQLYDEQITNGRKLFEKIADKQVQAMVEEWLKEVVYGLTNLIHIFNPPCIILGGGVLAQPYIMERLNQMVYESIMPSFSNVVLKPAQLGNQAGLLGATYMATCM